MPNHIPQSETSTFSQETNPSIRFSSFKNQFGNDGAALRAEQLRKEIMYARPESGKLNNPAVDKCYKCHGKVLLPDASYPIPPIIAHPFCDFNSFLRLWEENFLYLPFRSL